MREKERIRLEDRCKCHTDDVRSSGHSLVYRDIFIREGKREKERDVDKRNGAGMDYVICISEISFTTLRFLLPDCPHRGPRLGVRTGCVGTRRESLFVGIY